jgi:hypothetical protein
VLSRGVDSADGRMNELSIESVVNVRALLFFAL